MKKCPFCKIEKGKIIYENKYFYAIFDDFPVSPGYIIPRFFSDVKNPIEGIRNIISILGNYKIKG
jgi:hypothetical protein